MTPLQALHKAHKVKHCRTGCIAVADCRKPRRQAVENDRSRRPTIFEIKALVAKTYGISTVALESASRAVEYRLPRMVAIHLARRLTDGTLAEIGLRFGDRHHSTALYADRQMLKRRQQNPAFDSKLHAIGRLLRGR